MIRPTLRALTILFVVALAQPVAGQCNPIATGSVGTPQFAGRVAAAGHYAYVTNNFAGLQVIYVSSPCSVSIVGSAVTSNAFDVAIPAPGDLGQGFALVADRFAGLRVINVSNPAAPVVVGTVDTPGDALGVAVSQGLAYLTDRSGTLFVIDFTSNPFDPMIVGSLNLPSPTNVAVVGTTAYVTDDYSGLVVVDVSKPWLPAVVGSVAMPHASFAVTVVGNLAYVGAQDAGLQIVDVSNPAAPTIIGSLDTPGYVDQVVVVGTIAFVGDALASVKIVDVSNPTAPTVLTSMGTPGGGSGGLALSGSTLCVADAWSGLTKFDVLSCLPVTEGACCINGACITVPMEADCIAIGGTFRGAGASCESVACDAPCPADTNGDNQINVSDLLAVISAWGACP